MCLNEVHVMKAQLIFPLLPIMAGALFLSACQEEIPPPAEPTAEETEAEPEITEEVEPESRVFVFTGGSRIRFSGGEGEDAPRGAFANFVGQLDLLGNSLNPDGEHSLIIDMNSVVSRDQELMQDLKADEFFAVSFFPISTLNITSAVPSEEGLVNLTGTYQAHGASQEVTIPAQVRFDEERDRLMVSLSLPVKWRDYGIIPFGDNEDLVWEEGEIRMDLVAVEGEPREIELTPEGEVVTTLGAPSRNGGGGKGGFGGGKGGKGGKGGPGGMSREDWRNMSDEERTRRREEFFASIDTNGDGNLGKDEMPERMWEFMKRGDTNGDDMLSESERNVMRAQREAERAERELSGESFGRGPGGGRGPDGGRGPRGGDGDRD